MSVRFLIAINLIWLLLSSVGCASPLGSDEIDDPALASIRDAFERTVDDAHDDPAAQWHSGWMGNMQVNFWKGENYGLCHHWQDVVYAGVIKTVRDVGWRATGIRINDDTPNEHHAVVVYDPSIVDRAELLSMEEGQEAYVLDAWRRGKADIYRLREWVLMPFAIHRAAELEELPYRPPDGVEQPWLPRARAGLPVSD